MFVDEAAALGPVRGGARLTRSFASGAELLDPGSVLYAGIVGEARVVAAGTGPPRGGGGGPGPFTHA